MPDSENTFSTQRSEESSTASLPSVEGKSNGLTADFPQAAFHQEH